MRIGLLSLHLLAAVLAARGEETSPMAGTLTIEQGTLTVALDTEAHVYTLTDGRTGRVWTSHAAPDMPRLLAAEQPAPDRLVLTLEDPGTTLRFNATVSVPDADQVRFELDTEDHEAVTGGNAYVSENVVNVSGEDDLRGAMGGNLAYPPMLTSGLDRGKMFFCDRSCGVYTNLEDTTYGGRTLLVYGNTQCLDMPWLGVSEGAAGDGMMLLVETPFDAMVHLRPDGAGRHWPQISWLPSMGTFRYARAASYRFSPDGGYVALARQYRAWVDGRVKGITLAEKVARRPVVARLAGAPIVWGDIPAPRFVAQARPLGLTRGVIANAQYSVTRADLEAVNGQGYVTTTYDSIGDILEGETGFQRDDVEKTAYVTRPGGGPQKGWVTLDGLQFYFRSSAYALDALEAYVPQNMEQFGFNGRFMDVAVAMTLFEDYHPEHTFDRRQDQRYKRETMDYFNSFGVVVGTEHGNDWAIDQADYFEGATSGPFWWVSTEGGWNAGQLKRPTSRDQLTPEYLKYGMDEAYRIPLWELVYHDCAVTTWYWGDTAGFMYDVAPDISEKKDLFNILYGTAALLWRNDWGYGWDRNRDRFMQTAHWTSRVQGAVFGQKLTDHRFLTPDSRVQQTRFDSGTVCTVNFGDAPWELRADQGATLTLAPRGFHVKGPGLLQQRTWVDGEAVTVIETEGFRRVESPTERTFAPLTVRGTVTAHDTDGAWHVVVEKGSSCRVDVAGLTGAEGPVRLVTLDEDGATAATASPALEAGWLALPTADTTRVYRIEPAA